MVIRSGQLPLPNESSLVSFFALRWRNILGLEAPAKGNVAAFRAFYGKAREDNTPSTVAYLIDTLGFSPESAKRSAKFLNFKTLETPTAVLELFRSHGFSQSQVLAAVRGCPRLLGLDPDKILLPKLEFFYSVGASSSEVAEIVCGCPSILTHSLARTLVPSFNYYEGLFSSKEKAFRAIGRFRGVQQFGTGSSGACNLQVLRDCGVPECKLRIPFKNNRLALNANPGTFKSMVERVRGMGFDPMTTKFVDAVIALDSNRSTWDRKVEAFRRWGWSDEDLLHAFRLQPSIMKTSEEKIGTVMNFLVKEMGFEPSAVARCPVIIGMSFKKRIRPRAAVAQALVSKGLLKKNFSLKVFYTVESEFLKKLVYAYEDSSPDLLDMYRRELDDSEGSMNVKLAISGKK